jgi:hypothetical protein
MTSIGGISVSAGIEVDITPVDFGVNIDRAEGTVSIATGAEIPGGLLGVSGGIEVDLNTGEIIGGSIGGEVGGIGINLSSSKKGGLGIEFTLQIPGTPIELSLGFGFPPEEPTPTPTPTPDNRMPRGWEPTVPTLPPFTVSPGLYYVRTTSVNSDGRYWYHDGNGTTNYSVTPPQTGQLRDPLISPPSEPSSCTNVTQQSIDNSRESGGGAFYRRASGDSAYYMGRKINRIETSSPVRSMAPFGTISHYRETYYRRIRIISNYGGYIPGTIIANPVNLVYWWMFPNDGEGELWEWMEWELIGKITVELIKCGESLTPPPPLTPFPNPPPRKRNMDACCRDTLKMLREIRRFEQETMILLGRPLDPKGHLIPLPPNSKYFGEEIERIKTPIENIKDPEKEIIKFNNFYELQMYQLGQQINLDVGIDPQSFAAPSGMVQNPEYIRDSEKSLESNTQPQEDNFANKRQLEIGVDLKINSLSEQQQYIFEALKRLEYLFPYGELADAKFDKSLIIPGATGEIKVHNLIHFQEFFAQYLNATLGDPKIPIKIEDNNSLKEGKQEAIFRHFTIAQMIRELYRITLESGDDINKIMETVIRNFRTSLANRIQIIQTAEMTQALVEDTGMLESQNFIPVRLEGDPYAGKWKAGMGFEPDTDLDKNDEAATEKLMRATLKNFEAQVKVIRRDKRENSDIRDLLIQIAEMFIRSTAIPATKEGIEKALAAARFKTQVDMALTRSQVKRAAAASRSRTKKRKKQ